ncbi:MAG: radical SAM protein [Verrucomicrobiota bacterium]
MTPTKTEILAWLREENSARLEELWQRADDTRRRHVGNAVYLRGLIEISNHCVRQCGYCGLRVGNTALTRYRMAPEEILEAAREAVRFGYGTVVLQGGEDFVITRDWMCEVIRRIKAETPLAITLSLGERSREDLEAWRAAGADRYLLRFETSDRALFDHIHPGLHGRPSDRIALLRLLQSIGYEAGSGIMVGIPGQTYASVADDIDLFRELDLDMIGIGPFLPHPATPLGGTSYRESDPQQSGGTSYRESPTEMNMGTRSSSSLPGVVDDQIPNTELMVYKAVALTRLVRPDANIPSTTALATINKRDGRELGLQRGANVCMPNLTPLRYRKLYEIYPGKACIDETGTACNRCLTGRIHRIGRTVGRGPGGRRTREPEAAPVFDVLKPLTPRRGPARAALNVPKLVLTTATQKENKP